MLKRSLVIVLMITALACQAESEGESRLQGSWEPEHYLLKDGIEFSVTGQIFFTQTDWAVLFFVLGEDGTPQRGSGEGGTYTLKGDKLIFSHQYHLSAGEATGSLSESPLRMEITEAAEATREPCTVELDEERLTVNFPSGNAMLFRRRSGFDQ
jgi:hypothetical protein